jgi:MFS superfamily sulfate permease-like transporter
VLPALLVTVVVSLVVLVARAAAPRVTVLGRRPGTLELVDVRLDPAAHTVPGLLVLRLDQELFFANARSVHDAVLALVAAADPPIREVLVELSATTDLDVPGADALRELRAELGHHGVDLRLTRVRPPVAALLARHGWPAPPGLPLHARTLLGIVEHLRRHDGLAAERLALLADADAALNEVRQRLGPC